MTDESVFAAALALPDPAARAAYLDRVCAGNSALRAEVEALLGAHVASNPLDRPPANLAFTGAYESAGDADPVEAVGAIIGGRYKLLEALGAGGMSAVYMAQQTEPVKRLVAVKVIKAGMDSRQVLARFEAERQALALMDHPNIAKVLDAGTTDAGRPFFVMELVKGVPITAFCDERKLSPRERLELFVPVCQAIQHAHQKGVIHRDIKPGNVLVALYDGRPVPKVIDFGVAKAAGQPLTDMTLVTGFGAVVGTPEYMSPEQAELNQLDIDTRSEVFALGVLLYELLTGTTPLDRKRFGQAALLEILRTVREEEPPKPSTRVSTSGALAGIAASRSTDPARLSRLMKGELDWIVMKALEKDRNRRYDTATALARDIERHLAGDAVEACPPTLGYRFQKFIRKNHTAVRVATAFVSLGLGALAMGAYLAIQATRAEKAAEQRRIEAEEYAKRADANAEEAKENADAFWKASEANVFGRVDVEIDSLSLQIDLDLSEFRTDNRVGLLSLAKPLPGSVGPVVTVMPGSNAEMKTFISLAERPKYQALREFLAAAVLTLGQDYTSLLPPITHNGLPVDRFEVSPDFEKLLTFGADGTARLWDTRTARPIATLRHGYERVVNGGFSSDAKTVFTDDETGVARFWEPTDGKYRAKTLPRPNIYTEGVDATDDGALTSYARRVGRSACMIIGQNRLLTCHVTVIAGGYSRLAVDQVLAGPVELWDTTTGRFVGRLDRPGSDIREFSFVHAGEWITTVEGESVAVVFSTRDGREIARLAHPPGEIVRHMTVDPTGRRVATVSATKENRGDSLRLWDTQTWRSDPKSIALPQGDAAPYGAALKLWNHDLITSHGTTLGPSEGRQVIYRVGQPELLGSAWSFQLDPTTGDRVADSDGRVFDARTWKLQRPPAGQRYHPDLARFTLDGRFVNGTNPHTGADVLIDIRTEKQLANPLGGLVHLPGSGLVTVARPYGAVIRIVPTHRLDLPSAALELWAQVAVRGELGPDGEFVKWDEPTWEKKRQELAAIPPPYPDVPFPGYLATDRLHWLRAEFAASPEKDQPRLANELLRKAEAIGDKIEAIRWRAESAKYVREVAPSPREKP